MRHHMRCWGLASGQRHVPALLSSPIGERNVIKCLEHTRFTGDRLNGVGGLGEEEPG
jgi:hypothetical protein